MKTMLDTTTPIDIYASEKNPETARCGTPEHPPQGDEWNIEGWLPLALKSTNKGRDIGVSIAGDAWLTTPHNADGPLDAEETPPGVIVTATDCLAELRERARLGIKCFTIGSSGRKPYDTNRIRDEITSLIRQALEELENAEKAWANLCGSTTGHVRITITELQVHRKDQQEVTYNEAGHEHAGRTAVQNFVKNHNKDLVAYIGATRSAIRARIRSLQHAAQRFGVFDE